MGISFVCDLGDRTRFRGCLSIKQTQARILEKQNRSEFMQLSVENMAVIGQELAIRWSDGAESYYPLEFLRRHCPCALCAGERDIAGNVYRAEPKLTPKSFQLKSCASVGGYGIQPEWGDGHGSGIFSFSYLRSLDRNLS